MRPWPRPIIACLALLTACQDPTVPGAVTPGAVTDPAAAGSPPFNRAQTWNICQDPNRGLVAVNACTALLHSGQETTQTINSIRYNRGLALSRRGRTQAAIDDFDAVLAQDPFFALALYQRGLAYQQLGQQVRAEQDLRRARQLNSRLP